MNHINGVQGDEMRFKLLVILLGTLVYFIQLLNQPSCGNMQKEVEGLCENMSNIRIGKNDYHGLNRGKAVGPK